MLGGRKKNFKFQFWLNSWAFENLNPHPQFCNWWRYSLSQEAHSRFTYLRLDTILILFGSRTQEINNRRSKDVKKTHKKQKHVFLIRKKTIVLIPWLCSAAFRCKRWVWGLLSPHGWDIGLKGWDMGTDVWDIIDCCILKAGVFFNK